MLKNRDTCETDGSDKKALVAFSDCAYTAPKVPAEKVKEGFTCPTALIVTEDELDEGIKLLDKDGDEIDPPEY